MSDDEISERVQRMGSPIPARELRVGDYTLDGKVTKVTVTYTINGLTKHKVRADEPVRVYVRAPDDD